jgi:hypothetical protein
MSLAGRSGVDWLGRRRRHRRPDFLIIGAARCGTTSLFHYLARHPQVVVPGRKELHFFDRHYERGLDWYLQCFARTDGAGGSPASIRGEATPSYVFYPHAVPRISADVPDVKLIALLRNPVDRAYSQYWHMVRLGHESLSFEDAVAREPERLAGELERTEVDAGYTSEALVRHSYLARGVYADQIERVFRHFPPGRVKILKSEDLYTDAQQVLDEVTGFLGIPRSAIVDPRNMTAVTEGTLGWRPPPMPGALRPRLAAFFRPHNDRLYALLGRDLAWE